MGWREYVWVLLVLRPEYRREPTGGPSPVPPSFTGDAPTEMACVSSVVQGIHDRAYAHHRTATVIGNFSLLTGVDPWALTEWMWANSSTVPNG